MEKILCDCDVQNAIIKNASDSVITSYYKLMLHHGICVENLLKKSFQCGFSTNNIHFVRDTNNGKLSIITDFMALSEGNYENLTQSIINLAGDKFKAGRKSINKLLDILDKYLIEYISDTMIDFFSFVLLIINTYGTKTDDSSGKKTTTSFIIFRIIGPRIMKCLRDDQIINVSSIIKILNNIALDNKIEHIEYQTRLINIIANILMKHKSVNYICVVPVEKSEYDYHSRIILAAFQNMMSQNNNLFQSNHAYRNTFRVNSDNNINRTKARKNRLISKSCQHLLEMSYAGSDPDIKYFVLWNSDQISLFLEKSDIDSTFVTHWNLSGYDFINLDIISVQEMNIDVQILNVVDQIKSNSIIDPSMLPSDVSMWSTRDLSIWLVFNDLSQYLPVFTSNMVNGQTLKNIDSVWYRSANITNPKHISMIAQLKQQIA